MKKLKFGIRSECIGLCGRFVLPGKGECRKCRRARVHKGLKKIKKLERSK